MPNSQETRLLYGNMDSDTAIQLIEDKSVLNAVNITVAYTDQQNTGDAKFIDGNTLVGNIGSSNAGYKLIGKCTDEELQTEYLFMCSTSPTTKPHATFRFDKQAGTITAFFGNGNVSGGLAWTPDMYISARVANDLLIWATPGRGVSYLNKTTNYISPAVIITPEELSLVTEPPHVPLVVARDTDMAVTTNIQFTPVQFAYRFINTDNLSSVLSPDSLTLLPVRPSEIVSGGASFGNVANMAVDFDQKIPRNWKTVEFIVRYTFGNTFFVIKQFSINNPADVAAVVAHNAGSAQLSFDGWAGSTVYAIDAATAAKEFDNLSITTEFIELADNRLFLANNKNGYTTPVILPSYTIAPTGYQTNVPASTTQTAYLIYGLTLTEGVSPVSGGKTFQCYYAIIIRMNSKNYLLPKSFSIGQFYIDDSDTQHTASFDVYCTDPNTVWNLPVNIASNALIELKEIGNPSVTQYNAGASGPYQVRKNILQEANGVIPSWDENGVLSHNFYLSSYLDFELVDEPDEFGSASQSRTFLPNAQYKAGFQFYDGPMRKSGAELLETISFPAYGPFTRTLTEQVDFTINNPPAGSIPDWARYYAFTLSKNQKVQRIINFVSNVIKVVVRNALGELKYGGNGYLVTPPASYTLYGIAIPLQSIIQYGYGYAFTEGDYVELVGFNPAGTDDTSVIAGGVLTVMDGFAIIRYDATKYSELDQVICDASDKYHFEYNSGTNTATVVVKDAVFRQNTVLATIYNGPTADAELYEVAKFGIINNPGPSATFGNFFDSGSLTTSIFGDMYTQKRVAEAGAFTGYAITTYEANNLIAVNDTGRVTPVDTIGQKYLPTEIRWSNTNIPGTNTNGYASFDKGDYKIIEQTTGPITFIIRNTKGIQDGAQMIVLCSNGSYTALISKQQIYGADQNNAFVQQTTEVLGTVNQVRGGWGCQSPRSVIQFEGKVWWVDQFHKVVIEFNDSGAVIISEFKGNRLWLELLSRITDASFVTTGLNPYAKEVHFFVPAPNAAAKPALPTVPALENPLDCYYNQPYTLIYNWAKNGWSANYQNRNEMFNIGYDVYTVVNAGFVGQPARLWQEYTGTAGNYFGVDQNAMIVVPFNAQYPMVKAPLSLRLSCSRPPDETWIVATDGNAEQVAGTVSDWQMREGDGMVAIGRNRLSNNASSQPEWDLQNIVGWRLKGKTIQAVLIWYPANGPFTATSATLEYDVASGHK